MQLPLSFIGMLIVVALMVVATPIVKRRERKRFYDMAHRLDLEKGTIVGRQFTAGVLTTTDLRIVSLRPGSWEDVFRDVAEHAYMAGYNDQPVNRRTSGSRTRRTAAAGVPPRDLYFWAPAWRGLSQVTFPQLIVSIYPPGEAIGRDGTVVPAGHTGLMLSL